MEVLVAPENPGRILAVHVGRELLFKELIVKGLFRMMVFHGERMRNRQQHECGDQPDQDHG